VGSKFEVAVAATRGLISPSSGGGDSCGSTLSGGVRPPLSPSAMVSYSGAVTSSLQRWWCGSTPSIPSGGDGGCGQVSWIYPSGSGGRPPPSPLRRWWCGSTLSGGGYGPPPSPLRQWQCGSTSSGGGDCSRAPSLI
jgi:hypothetical protein